MHERNRYLRRSKRRRWRRWMDGIDPWMPRPVDYLAAAALFLGLSRLYVGERSYAVELARGIFRLEERRASLRDRGDVLASRATALGDRDRVMCIAARELGMVVPGPDAFVHVYYVPEHARAWRSGAHAAASPAGLGPAPVPRHGR